MPCFTRRGSLAMTNTLYRFKNTIFTFSLLFLALFWNVQQGMAGTDAKGGKVYSIGFHFWKSGKIYDEAYQGIIDSLALEKINFQQVIINSGLDRKKARENLLAMDKMGLDCLVSMSSEGTQIVQDMHLKTPVIAAVVNHPFALGIVDEKSATKNLTGLCYFINPEKQLQLFKKLFPAAKHIGMIYDQKNPAGFLAEEPLMAKACDKMDLRFSSVGIVGKSDIVDGAKALLEKKVDVIVVPTNLEVYGNLSLILDLVYGNKTPIVSLNKQGVDNGALAALFADNYKLGRMAGPMIAAILFGQKPPGEIPFAMVDSPDLIINLGAANRLDYEFPPDILVSASIVLH